MAHTRMYTSEPCRADRSTLLAALVLTCSLLLLGGGPALATDDHPGEATGYKQSSYSLSNYETINLGNGNLTFKVPLNTLFTDGGLSYEIALYHNMKRWTHERWCWDANPPYTGSCGPEDPWYAAEIADGIESYGFTWDLRPERIVLAEGNYIRSASGEKHYLLGGSPAWENEGGWSARCKLSDNEGDPDAVTVCFTDTNIRVTALGFDDDHVPTGLIAESPDGTTLVYAHKVSNPNPNPIPVAEQHFQHDRWGYYLTAIERGPWIGGSPANRITFEYCSDPGVSCGSGVADAWLLGRVTATGGPSAEPAREVRFEYNSTVNAPYTVLTGVWIPSFDPLPEGVIPPPPPTYSQITFVHEVRSFTAYGFPGADGHGPPQSMEVPVPYLKKVCYPDQSSFTFDSSSQAVVGKVTLPSGAMVEYIVMEQSWPLGMRNCVHHSGYIPPEPIPPDPPESTFGCDWPENIGCFCSSGSPPVLPPLSGVPSSSDYGTEGVYSRTIRYHDAEQWPAEAERFETTVFRQYKSCVAPCDDGQMWPYSFSYGLEYGDYELTHYLWTVVEVYSTDDQSDNKVVEIHRFNPFNYREFSVDYLDTVPATTLIGPVENGGENFDAWTGVKRLRHVELEYHEKNDLGNFPLFGGFQELFRYDFLHRKSEYTVRLPEDQNTFCYEPVDPGDPQPEHDCTEATELVPDEQIDDYLNVLQKTLTVANPVSGLGVAREWVNTYYPFELSDPEESPWRGLNRLKTERVCDGSDCSTSALTWEEVTHSGGTRGLFRIFQEFINPQGSDSFECNPAPDGCVVHTYACDGYGNRITDTVEGGYDNGPEPPTTFKFFTSYSNGRPDSKWLQIGVHEILRLWEREIDKNTGLARWHVDGSGAGYAYLYNGMGRVTEIAPVELYLDDVSARNLRHQCARFEYGGDCLEPLHGTKIEYVYPDPPDPDDPPVNIRLEHRVYDSVYEVGPAVIPLALEPGAEGVERSRYIFDGLGRLTQTVEQIPVTDPQGPSHQFPWRSRFNLDYFDAEGHVQKSSEWHDGSAWPSDPSLLRWTITRLDGLGRPTRVKKPDDSEDSYEYEYLGDAVTTVTRRVGDVIGSENPYEIKREVDALGRLRKLDEEVASGTSILTEYSYDEKDRLAQVRIAGQTGQTRTFQYSNGGFLTESREPERITTYEKYDALGNLLSETTSGWTATFTYDGFGRLMTKAVTDGSSASLYYGDTFLGAGEWQPAYSKVVRTEQINVYPNTEDTVTVTHDWTFDGPGSRVRSRATSISGLGDEEDRFELGYEYDRWGNPSRVFHPWWAWTEDCNPPLLQEHVFDGPWLIRSDFYLDGEAFGGVDLAYHENGRTSQVDFYLGQHSSESDGHELESEDPNGMPRPRAYELRWDQGLPGMSLIWNQGDYSYDGSGNITAIGGTPVKHYTYDGLNRLTGYYEGDGPDPAQDYSYDNYGNLERLGDLEFTVNSQNRLTTITLPTNPPVSYPVGWNGRGNLTNMPEVLEVGLRGKEFWYSKEDRLMKSKDTTSPPTPTWRFAYDAAGERVAAWQRASGELMDLTVFLRDEAGRVLSDWQLIPGVSFGPKRDYLYAGDRLAVQLDWSEGESPVRKFVAVDHLNSTRAIVDDNGIVEKIDYLPFGGFLTGGPVPDTTHLFTGHERDTATLASNLDYMHARYFSPNVGRFLSVDPIGGAVGSSQSWNRYSYALNNPLTMFDPTGMEEERTFLERLWDRIALRLAPKTPVSDGEQQAPVNALLEGAGIDPEQGLNSIGTGAAANIADGARDAVATLGSELTEQAGYAVAGGIAGKAVGRASKAVNLPAWRKVALNMEHVVSGHMVGGSRVSAAKSVFPAAMTETQVGRAIREAYRYGSRVATQGERVLIRGEASGLKIEMWVNTTTKTIESAYPF